MLHATPGAPEGSRLPFRGAGATHVGHVRTRNEDAWAVSPGSRCAVVADGMGGHPAGDVASRIAVDAFTRFVEQPSYDSPDEAPTGKDSGVDRGEWMAEAVLRAHRGIRDHVDSDPESEGMGTTLTGFHLSPDGAWIIGHVGDSRAYRFRGSRLEPLTQDQSPLRDAIDSGRMSREQARNHPWAHVLSQAVGTAGDVDPEVLTGTALPGDLFLICSDGLTKVLTEEEMAEILAHGVAEAGEVARNGEEGGAEEEVTALDSILDALIRATLERGAPDNVTVVLVATGPVTGSRPAPPGTDPQ